MKRITMVIAVNLMVMLSGMLRAQVSVWDGSAEPWTHGSGTAEDPYLIESAANLAYLSQECLIPTSYSGVRFEDTCFLLTTDLNLGKDKGLGWMPIGINGSAFFAGHFDGGRHTVDGMWITDSIFFNMSGSVTAGLFGTVQQGSIQNLTMGENCLIEIDELFRPCFVGMVVGMVSTVQFNQQNVLWPYLISGCHNKGTISVAMPEESEIVGIGGLVGYAGPYLRMEGCVNSGTLSLEMPMRRLLGILSEKYIGPCLGGLVGVVFDRYNGCVEYFDNVPLEPVEFMVENCHNAGALHLGLDLRYYEENKRAHVGGIIGNAGYLVGINRCSNCGNLTVELESSTGLAEYEVLLFCSGIVGGYGNDYYSLYGEHYAHVVANVTNCYNHASVRCEVEDGLNVETAVSGISGKVISTPVAELHVSNCYHVGELIADEANGITPADTLEVLEVTNSYYLEGNAPDNGIGTPKTDEEMKSQAFVDLLNGDGPETFYFDEWDVNDGYPVLDDKKPFLANSEWYYEIVMADGGICYQYLQCAGDTTIGSERPKVVVRTNQIYDKEAVEVTREYLYEEDDVVYWWNKELEEFTVLYDFGAEVGDEWETKVGGNSITVHVDAEKPYQDPNTGRTYRMLVVSDAEDVFSGEIICGVGHTTSLFPEKLMGHRSKFQVDGLRCYWNNQVLVLHTSTDDCDAIYSQFHGVDESTLTEGVRVYPNPTDGLITIEMAPSSQTAEYRITNVLGQTLLMGTSLQPNLTIDVSSLPSGLYFLTLGERSLKFVVR